MPPLARLVGAEFRAVIAVPGTAQFHTSRHHPAASPALPPKVLPAELPDTPRGWPLGAIFESRGFRDSEFSGVGAPSSRRVGDPLPPARLGRFKSALRAGRPSPRPDHHHTPIGQSPVPEENQR